MAKYIMMVLFAISLVACKEVKIENGQIPDEYLDEAAIFVGSYDGEFNKQPGRLDIALHGNHMSMAFVGRDGNDLLDTACESQIGDLKSVSVRDKGEGEYELRRATFAFNPNKCLNWVLGDSVDVRVSVDEQNVTLHLALLEEYETDRNCRYEPPPPAGSGRRVCDPPMALYLWGKFVRPLNFEILDFISQLRSY